MSSQSDLIPIRVATSTQQCALLEGLHAWLNLRLIEDGQVSIRISAKNTDQAIHPNALLLETALHSTQQDLLAGLDAWLQMGLLTQASLTVEIKVSATAPNLLEGIEYWVQLNLLSQTEVLQICRTDLACWLPTIAPQPVSLAQQPSVLATRPLPENRPIAASQSLPVSRPAPLPPSRPKTPSRVSQVLQSLAAELSVLWLLLLGVFMVVISSAVLAASQWERFPSFIQYGILWLYTLGFWGSSFWAGHHPNLRLTTQALRIITLLLVPLNFLAIDSFGLWRSPLQWLVVGVAAASLTGLTMQIFQEQLGSPEARSRITILLLNHLGLSYLHLGWGIPSFPLLATYIGVVGTTFLSRYARWRSPATPVPESQLPSQFLPFNLSGTVVLYAVAIVLLRAIFIARIAIIELGLAIGMCGWLLIQQAPLGGEETRDQPVPRSIWERWGSGLLFLGWVLSVGTFPWQALILSSLAVLVFTQRVLRTWSRGDLSAILLIGLQMFFLAWYVVPPTERQGLLEFATRLTGTEAIPVTLLGVVLFPYLVILLALFDGLMQIRRRELAEFTGRLALACGATLIVLSLASPLLRTINFGLSTVALGMITSRQQQRNLELEQQRHLPATALRSLAGMTHLGGLVTLFFAIKYLQPKLGLVPWAGIGLGFMVWEWLLSLRQPLTPDPNAPPTTLFALLCQSCWNFGLILSGLSYLCLLINLSVQPLSRGFLGYPVSSPTWGGFWLITPLILTGLIARVRTRRSLAGWLSVVALVLAQGLTLSVPQLRSLSLGIAAGGMLVNTHYLQELLAAVLTVGLGLAFIGALIQQFLPTLPLADWVLLGAIATLTLWLLRHSLAKQSTLLAGLYRQATDGWAIFLCSVDGILLILPRLNPEAGLPSIPTIPMIAAALLLMAASAYRSWQTRQPSVLWYSVAVVLVLQLPFLPLPETRWISLAAATLLLLIQTRLLQHLAAAAITIELGLSLISSVLWLGLPQPFKTSLPVWILISAIVLTGLWLLRHGLIRCNTPLTALYATASDGWAIGLGSLILVALTLHSLLVYWNAPLISPLPVIAAAISVGAIAYRGWQYPTNWTLYALGWGLELLTLEVVGITGSSTITLAIANTALGLLTQVIGDWWHRRTDRPYILSCWHILPLLYGALGSALRWNLLTSWTGLSSLGLVLIAIGVGRRQPAFKPLLYLAVVGISLSAYELLLYQVIHLSLGDQLLAMAALTTTIVYAYRVLTPWLTDYLRLTSSELRVISHFHWGWGSLLLLAALPFPAEANKLVGLGAGIFLIRYAIMQGRNPANSIVGELWVCLGMLEAIGIVTYIDATMPFLSATIHLLNPWRGAIAAGVATTVYLLPWQRWGWSNRPWQTAAILAPGAMLFTGLPPHPVSLLIMAGFYIWLGRQQQQLRWFYGSLLLINWAVWLFLPSENSTFAHSCVIGLSLLSITWFEPTCCSEAGRSLRHYLRCLGLGLIGAVALVVYPHPGSTPALVGIIGIFLGLGLRIRAFLYIGTITFLAISTYQMVLLIFTYPLLKWVIGLLTGIAFIWIAASFENRRHQFVTLLHNWLVEFEAWE
jgi:hypothetical protein